jgi:hypothetical protein
VATDHSSLALELFAMNKDVYGFEIENFVNKQIFLKVEK